MEMANIDLDLFNKEQRPCNYDCDCLEYWQYLYETGKIDNSDELYEARRDEQVERELDLLYEWVQQQW